MMQLSRYLALCGVASRRKANLIILQGRVVVNGKVVEELGWVVEPERDAVLLDSRRLALPRAYRYILLHKPSGVITTVVDRRGRKTVLDLVDVDERVYPVGRLDYDTEGVLLLTNDGELAYRLAHPRYGVTKVYEAWVEGRVSEKDVRRLEEGVVLKGSVVVKGEASILDREAGRTLVELRVHEGRKRQIKRMLKAVGHPVVCLKRTLFAELTVDGLERGAWRDLTESEVESLYALTALERKVV